MRENIRRKEEKKVAMENMGRASKHNISKYSNELKDRSNNEGDTKFQRLYKRTMSARSGKI